MTGGLLLVSRGQPRGACFGGAISHLTTEPTTTPSPRLLSRAPSHAWRSSCACFGEYFGVIGRSPCGCWHLPRRWGAPRQFYASCTAASVVESSSQSSILSSRRPFLFPCPAMSCLSFSLCSVSEGVWMLDEWQARWLETADRGARTCVACATFAGALDTTHTWLSNWSTSARMFAQASAGQEMQFRLHGREKKRSTFAAFGAASLRYTDWRQSTRACGSVQDGKRQTTYR